MGQEKLKGTLVRLSKTFARISLEAPLKKLTNIKMNLVGVDENLAVREFYGKVTQDPEDDESSQVVHFTSVPPEIDAYFQALRRHAAKPG